MFLLLLICLAYGHQAQDLNEYRSLKTIRKNYYGCFDTTNRDVCMNAAWELSFIGLYKTAIAVNNMSRTENYPGQTNVDSTKSLQYVDVFPYLDSVLQNQQIVMMNETHHNPIQRNYSLLLLNTLKKHGFTYAGFEGLFCNYDPKAPVKMNSGYYTIEPCYANLVNTARNLGFKTFAYESCPYVNENREINSGYAIRELLLKDPKAKIFLHVGYGHLREDTVKGKCFAYWIKQLTGIDPYTIGQTRLCEQAAPRYENKSYQSYQLSGNPTTVFCDGKVYQDGIVDLTVFMPRVKMDHNRPDFMLRNELLYRTVLSCDSFKGKDCTVFVYPPNYEPDDVPTDVMELTALNSDVYLFSIHEGLNKVLFRDNVTQKIYKTLELTFKKAAP